MWQSQLRWSMKGLTGSPRLYKLIVSLISLIILYTASFLRVGVVPAWRYFLLAYATKEHEILHFTIVDILMRSMSSIPISLQYSVHYYYAVILAWLYLVLVLNLAWSIVVSKRSKSPEFLVSPKNRLVMKDEIDKRSNYK